MYAQVRIMYNNVFSSLYYGFNDFLGWLGGEQCRLRNLVLGWSEKYAWRPFFRRLWCTLWFGTSLQRQYHDVLRIDSFDLLLVKMHFYH